MSRELARINRRYAYIYYRRLARAAVREATRVWIALLSAAFVVAVLTFGLLLVGGGSGLDSAAWGLAAFGLSWLLIIAWYVVTIPPRIERDMQNKEESLQAMTQRRGVAVELRNHMIVCQSAAREAREKEIDAEGRGAHIFPDAYHQIALKAATDATDRLKRLGTTTGQHPYDQQIQEINGAVKSRKAHDADDAIAQLEALADVFERQLTGGYYW